MFFKMFKIEDQKFKDSLVTAGTIGLHLVSGTFVGFFMGYFLDKWLQTGPWLTVVFLVLGVVAGYLNVYRDMKALLRGVDDKADENSSGQDKPQD